jgi:hypothetical protein
MTEEFATLKAEALTKHATYVDTLENFAYEDVQDLKKRIELLTAYNEALLSNIAYRTFISHNVIRKVPDSSFTTAI